MKVYVELPYHTFDDTPRANLFDLVTNGVCVIYSLEALPISKQMIL